MYEVFTIVARHASHWEMASIDEAYVDFTPEAAVSWKGGCKHGLL